MEPNWYASIGGIVLFTLAIVQALKSWLGDADTAFAKVPTTIYVLLVSLGLTVVANKVLGTLPTDNFPQLLIDAVTAALGATGLFETFRPSNLTKRIADSGRRLGVLFLAVGLAVASTGCASALVATEGAIHRSIAVTQDTANALCDARLQSVERCRDFNVKLIPVIASAKAFNRAVRENSAAEVPAMLAALVGMRDAVVAFFPPDLAATIRARIESTYGLVAKGGR